MIRIAVSAIATPISVRAAQGLLTGAIPGANSSQVKTHAEIMNAASSAAS
jgi:hypothetical protein